MDLNALKQAVLNTGSLQAPVVNTNSTGANAFTQAAIQHIDAMQGQSTRANAAKIAGGALYGGVSQQAIADSANATAAADAAKQKAETDAQAASDMQDPSKYTRAVNKSGGYSFYAPNGTEITATQYAQITGKHVTDVLKGSQNTVDQKFLNDYKEVQNLGAATAQGGAALQKYLTKNPEVAKLIKQNGLSKYSDVVSTFKKSYPQYFNSGNNIGNASYNNNSVGDNSGNQSGFLQKIGQLISGFNAS